MLITRYRVFLPLLSVLLGGLNAVQAQPCSQVVAGQECDDDMNTITTAVPFLMISPDSAVQEVWAMPVWPSPRMPMPSTGTHRNWPFPRLDGEFSMSYSPVVAEPGPRHEPGLSGGVQEAEQQAERHRWLAALLLLGQHHLHRPERGHHPRLQTHGVRRRSRFRSEIQRAFLRGYRHSLHQQQPDRWHQCAGCQLQGRPVRGGRRVVLLSPSRNCSWARRRARSPSV